MSEFLFFIYKKSKKISKKKVYKNQRKDNQFNVHAHIEGIIEKYT